MATFALILILAVLGAALVRYARHDRFAGPSVRTNHYDEFGPVELRRHLVPRRG